AARTLRNVAVVSINDHSGWRINVIVNDFHAAGWIGVTKSVVTDLDARSRRTDEAVNRVVRDERAIAGIGAGDLVQRHPRPSHVAETVTKGVDDVARDRQ